MLGDNDFKEIEEIFNQNEEGNYFRKRKLRKKKQELSKNLDDLSFIKIDLCNAKIRNSINSVRREIKKIDIDTINHTARDEELKNIPGIEEKTKSRFFNS